MIKFNPKTQTATIDGEECSLDFIEEIVGKYLSGRVVHVLPARDETGALLGEPLQCQILGRSGTDAEGHPTFTQRLTDDADVMKRIRRSDSRWNRREAPNWKMEGCTYPACACRPDRTNKTKAAKCEPKREIDPPNAHIIIPACGVCGNELRVSAAKEGAEIDGDRPYWVAMYQAHCTHGECGWEGTINVLLQTSAPPEEPPPSTANRDPDVWQGEEGTPQRELQTTPDWTASPISTPDVWAGPGALPMKGLAGERFDVNHPAVSCEWCGDGTETETHQPWCDRPSQETDENG